MLEEKDLQAIAQLIDAKLEKHGEMLSRIQEDQTQMRKEQTRIQEDISDLRTAVTRVAVTQENVVLKSLDALAEGHDLIHQRLKDLAGKDELAELREEVRLLRSVVAQHSREIEALKAAQ